MALFRCNTCAHLQEQSDGLVGESIACPQCGNPAMVYGTLFFVGKLLEKYFEARREVIRLQTAVTEKIPGSSTKAAAAPEAPDTIDLANTDRLACELQHRPILDWFSRKHIRIQANMRGVDTTGFFDEVAMTIGSNLPVLKEVIERIRWAQQKDYSSTTIQYDKKSPAEVQTIASFCQQLYDYSFVAKCLPSRQKNHVLLVLQTAPAIRQFFNGEWLEWFALMTCLGYTRERQKPFSCARNLSISLASNNESYELDVFLLIDGQLPICIECKTGEFRQDIEKSLTVRKRLDLSGRNFVMCITGLSDEHAKGLSAMYDLTFVNERELLPHLTRLF